jgi:hypothetical protein
MAAAMMEARAMMSTRSGDGKMSRELRVFLIAAGAAVVVLGGALVAVLSIARNGAPSEPTTIASEQGQDGSSESGSAASSGASGATAEKDGSRGATEHGGQSRGALDPRGNPQPVDFASTQLGGRVEQARLRQERQEELRGRSDAAEEPPGKLVNHGFVGAGGGRTR